MAIKDLLTIVRKGTEAGTPYAVWLAGACGATLTASTLVIEPDVPLHVSLELPQTWLDRIREEAAQDATAVLQKVAEVAKGLGSTIETVKWSSSTGEADRDAARLARYYDLTVLRQPDPDGTDTMPLIEAVMFESGRPVLIIPYISARAELGTALVAWDGGPAAARAVADALPLLSLAKHVEVVTVSRDDVELSRRWGERLVQHLRRHGIAAESRHLVSEMDVGSTLLSQAADIDADLLVMGAYGHSRLREIILGGTTREILRSMTIPVLMSH